MTQNLSNHGIGASEIAAIAGLNPFASPWDVWLRKTGQAPDVEPSAPMEWGNRLEPAIRQAYADKTGLAVAVPEESLFREAPAWARATPDGICYESNRRTHLLQCKNVGHWVEKAWHEAPPAYVQLQEQWEMFVTDDKRADVAVLIGGNDFRVYTVHRDDKIIADLVDIADGFWKLVTAKTPPKVDESDACQRHFEGKLAKRNAVSLMANVEDERLFARWFEATQQAKRAEKEIATCRNLVRQQLAEAGAERFESTIGTATLVGGGEKTKTETDWKAIAHLAGSMLPPSQWHELLAGNTKVTTSETPPTLYAPRTWAKEAA